MMKMPDVDIIITHFMPLFLDQFFELNYSRNAVNELSCFDGNFLFSKTKKYIYGHLHQIKEFSYNDVDFYTNSIGKPGENFKSFEDLTGLLKNFKV